MLGKFYTMQILVSVSCCQSFKMVYFQIVLQIKKQNEALIAVNDYKLKVTQDLISHLKKTSHILICLWQTMHISSKETNLALNV